MRLKRKFFNRSTLTVAKELLGKYLYRRINGKILCARITETEAYCGEKDLACHASKGLTERTKVMFGPPGHAYVYLIYGMYHCFNVVTREKGCPEAVLIRGCEIFNGLSRSELSNLKAVAKPHSKVLLRGPGRLCRELKVDKKFNGVDLCNNKELWIEDRGEKPSKIKKDKRVNIEYAGEYKNKLWRFFLE